MRVLIAVAAVFLVAGGVSAQDTTWLTTNQISVAVNTWIDSVPQDEWEPHRQAAWDCICSTMNMQPGFVWQSPVVGNRYIVEALPDNCDTLNSWTRYHFPGMPPAVAYASQPETTCLPFRPNLYDLIDVSPARGRSSDSLLVNMLRAALMAIWYSPWGFPDYAAIVADTGDLRRVADLWTQLHPLWQGDEDARREYRRLEPQMRRGAWCSIGGPRSTSESTTDPVRWPAMVRTADTARLGFYVFYASAWSPREIVRYEARFSGTELSDMNSATVVRWDSNAHWPEFWHWLDTLTAGR